MYTGQNSQRHSHAAVIISLLIIFTVGSSPIKNTQDEPAIPVSPVNPPVGWYALPNKGLGDGVYALQMSADDLYVGGSFDSSGDGALTEMGNIARFNIPSTTWHTLSNKGLDDGVDALALHGDNLYVGGHFSTSADGNRNVANIARYNILTNSWHALENKGLKHQVTSIAVSEDDLYVGGWFEETVDSTLKDLGHIVSYDTSNKSWEALENKGLDNTVFALAVKGADLYAAGRFKNSGDLTVKDMIYIAHYDTRTDTWERLPDKGLNGQPKALAVSGDDLYIGGEFSRSVEGSVTDLGNIVRYDTSDSTWHALSRQGLNGEVKAFAISGDDLYVGGNFSETGDGQVKNLGGIARYNTTDESWHALPNQGFNGNVHALAASSDGLFAAGSFIQTGDGWLKELGCIARSALDVEYLPLSFNE